MVRNATLLRPLGRAERAFLVAFLLVIIAYGGLTLKRSAFLRRRMGDIGCYLRAGWAMRAGGQHLYHLKCDNGWHYNYPPTFAVLMMPLADPPERDLAQTAASSIGLGTAPGMAGPLLSAANLAVREAPVSATSRPSPPGGLPYPVSVVVFYLVNLLCLALAVHLLAGSLEQAAGGALPVGCRGWWWLRVLPVLVCLPPIGHTLMRGQTNVMLLLCVCGMASGLLRQQRLRAGLWLAGAICLKIFPAYLLVVPLLRRDLRCAAGCGLGLVVGLGLVPLAALGATQTIECYKDLGRVLVAPALRLGDDTSRAKELIEVTATDNVSFQTVIHNNLHPDPNLRPPEGSAGLRRVHLALAAGLTLATLLAGWRHSSRSTDGPALVVWIGALVLIMLLSSPVCHSHYFTLSVVIVMGLLAAAWERAVTPLHRALGAAFLFQVAGSGLPLLPGLDFLRERGLLLAPALVLWATGAVVLMRRPAERAEEAPPREARAA
jgi:hypothetical protein